MPTVTGPWVPNASSNQRAQLILDYSLSSTATHTTVSGTVKLGAGWSFYDSSNQLAWSGSLLGSGSKSNISISVPTNGQQVIHSFTQTVPRTSSAQGMTVAFTLSGIEYVGATPTVSATISIPAMSGGTTPAPSPTGGVTLTRISDSQHTVRWDAVPNANFYGLGRSINGGSYVWLGWVDAPQVTYNLTGTSSDQAVSVSVFARIGTSDSPAKYSALAYTTPANASNITFTQAGPDRGTLTWARNANYIGSQDVQVSTNAGATWTNVSGHTGLSASTYSRTITSLSPGPSYQFRIVTKTPAPVISNASSASAARVLSAVPAAPTGVTATRNTDSSWTVTWSGTADSWRITRSINGGTWTTVASGITNRTATVTGTAANQWVRFNVVGRNVAGEGGVGNSPSYYTTPTAPSNLVATRLSTGDVRLSWTKHATYGTKQEILAASRPQGGVWSAWSTVIHHDDLAPSLTGATIGGLSLELEWRFQVRVHTTPPALTATSTASNTVTVGQRPHPPTILAPQDVAAPGDVTLRWRHNSSDTSEQTAFEVQWDGGTLTGGVLQQTTITVPPAATTVAWSVRTKGQHADWSDWSAAVFDVVPPPTATITSPPAGSPVETNRPTLAWTYTGSSPQVAWRVEVWLDGALVQSLSGTTETTTTLTLPTGLDGTELFIVRLWVTSSLGMESAPAELDFNANVEPPAPPTLDAKWDGETGRVHLTVGAFIPTPAIPGLAIPGTTLPGAGVEDVDYADTVAVRAERFDQDTQQWVTVDEGAEVWDWQAPLRADVLYRGVAIAASGGEAYSEPVTVTTDTCRTFLHVDGLNFVWLESNQTIDTASSQHRAVEHYEGHDYPTAHYGVGRTRLVSLAATLWDGEGLDQDLDAALYGRDVFYRSPLRGEAWWGTVGGISVQQDWHKLAQLRLTVERVGGHRG